MPEMHFTVRWPDGTEASYYSPSLVVHDHLAVGEVHPVAEFVERAHTALDIASERVRAKYGFACTSAMHTRDEIDAAASASRPGEVVVLRMDPPLPGGAA